MDSIRLLPGYRPAADTTHYLAPERIAKYGSPAWKAYVDRSKARYDKDTASMHAELRAANMATMTRGPYTHDFSVKPYMTDAWFASDSARRMADVILSFQAPNGGWSKHVDFGQHVRAPGESYFAESADWEWISTIDNNSTTEEIKFLALADRAHHDPRFGPAISRAIEYLLVSQMPNGCFPQVYPLQGSYHDAVTFNDDAMVNALRILQSTANGTLSAATADQRRRAASAVTRGVDCILAAQVVDAKQLSIWGQQHDPLTLRPVSARSYEPASLAPQESAVILDFLMELPAPSAQVVRSVYAGAEWLKSRAMFGYRYERYQLTAAAGAGPLWGRMLELGSSRPIMSNRDGIILYDWDKLTDRRSGYGWYTTAPQATLARFDAWAKHHPRLT